MKIELDLPEVTGYEYTGEYRIPREGEPFKGSTDVRFADAGITCEFPILKKKAPKYKVLSSPAFDGVYVEIKALEDALDLIFCVDLSPSSLGKLEALKALTLPSILNRG